MSIVISVAVLIIMLGIMIVVHELGHFVAAKRCGVHVIEFSIGMGPVIWSRDGIRKPDDELLAANRREHKSRLTLRAFPIGGSCMMEGEDEDSGHNDAFNNRPIWARFIILAAGSFMNIVLGVILLFIINMPNTFYTLPVITATHPDFEYGGENGLMAGDRILSVNGHKVNSYRDFKSFLTITAGKPFNFTVLRGGEKVHITALPMVPKLFEGESTARYGLDFGETENATLWNKLKNTCYDTSFYARVVWLSLGRLASGEAKPNEFTGPVGMGDMVNDIVTENRLSIGDRVMWIIDLTALITVNLAIFNMLPLPALDGGRILFLLISCVSLLLFKKPVNAKLEGYIHAVGLALFMLFAVYIMFNDILRIAAK